jgi:hypothetical protein
MDARRNAIRDWINRIRDVLNTEWKPIPGDDTPEDEYDQYAHGIASRLAKGASDAEIIAYLEWVEVENMGLGGPFNPASVSRVITALRALGTPGDSP